MNTQVTFTSQLADVMDRFTAFKRMQGYDYSSQAQNLKRFDTFLRKEDCSHGLLCNEMFRRFATEIADSSAQTRKNLLSSVREFSLYLHAHRPESCVMPAAVMPHAEQRIRFYRIEPEQVQGLMAEALRLSPKKSVRPQCICFLIGLLYCTGLRINEALNLNLNDVDLARSTLYVRSGKFNKARLVPLSSSAVQRIEQWLEMRSRYGSISAQAPLLLGAYNKRLTLRQADYAFKVLCRRCGLNGQPPPRLHDLRHNYACRCIARWRDNGEDVQALLPVLAEAMGHVNIFATQIYIHIEASALQQACSAFRNHFTEQKEQHV